MLRVYVKKGHSEQKPNGTRTLYASGHYNLDDAKARAMVADGKAQFVDENDDPIEDVRMAPMPPAPADEPSAVIAFDEEEDL